MENGVNLVVDDNPVVGVEASAMAVDLPSSEKIEKMILGSSHESMDSEGNCAFVGAIGSDAEEHAQVKAEGTSDVVLGGWVAHAEKAPDSEPPKEVDGDSESGHEAVAFPKAISIPDAVTIAEPELPLQVVVQGEVRDLVVLEPPVNEDSNSEVARDSNDEVSASVVAAKPAVKEVVVDEVASKTEFRADESKEALDNGLLCHGEDGVKEGTSIVGRVWEVGMELGDKASMEKSESGHSDHVNLNGGAVFEKSENSNAAEVTRVADSVYLDAKSDGEFMIHQDTREKLKHYMAKPSTEDQYDRNASRENSDSAKFTTLSNSVHLDAKSIRYIMIPEDTTEALKHNMAKPGTEHQDDMSAHLENAEHRCKGDKIEDAGARDFFAHSATRASEIESSTSVEPSVVEIDEASKVHKSDSGHRGIKSPQTKSASGNIDGICDDHAVVDETKRDSTGDEGKKETDEGKSEWKIQPVAEADLSSAKPANPAPHPAHPDGLGGAAPLLEPAPRAHQQPRVTPSISSVQAQLTDGPKNGEAEETDETREKLQILRVKFLRLAYRLGQTPHNVVVAQVLYRLGLAEQLRGRNGGRVGAFSFDRASAKAEQLEAAGQAPLDFSCTIMVIGKTGVGKSATINSIFDGVKFGTNAFDVGTTKVQDFIGTVQGIKVRVIDTPGLLPFWSDQRKNEKILSSIKRFIKKSPPDIVLYLDRLDMQTREFGEMPLLRTITEVFGTSIWFNAIVVLTHAATAPPEGPNGIASTYDMFVAQRSHLVQQAIRQAAGDMRLMNPVCLVENHSACRTNRAGQRVLPNGQIWKPHLLLLSFASKILAEANALLKLQDSPPDKPFATPSRLPPLPFFLSSLIQSRPQLKLPEEQLGDEDTLGDSFDESSDSDNDIDYEELPPFKSLTKVQLQKLTKDQRKAYFDELEYREKLLYKTQMKNERRRRKFMKEMAGSAQVPVGDSSENAEEESGGPATAPDQMADMVLPASFDSDNPTHRYRFLDSPNQWLVRPVLDAHGWDHDVGYEGINVEKVFVVKDKIPLSFSGQVTKDKKDTNLQIEVASSIKHGQGKSSSLGFDMQTAGKDMIYTVRGETMFSNHKRNKATAGLSATLLGDTLSTGVKLEDKLIVNKRLQFVLTGGAMTGRGEVAYGGSLEATLRDKDFPLGRSLSTLLLSIMDWHGDLAIGCNAESQIPVGRSTKLIARANLNNKGTGQVSIRLNSSEHWEIVLVSLIPLVRKLRSHLHQLQYGQ